MKILQQELAQKLTAVKPAIPSNPSTAALKGVLVKDNKLTAYNLEYGITVTLDVHVDECFILPAEAVQMVESLPEGEIEITVGPGNILEIKAGDIVHKVSSHPPEDFPELPRITSDEHITIDAGTLTEGIEAVIYAVSANDDKPVQKGVLFEADKSQLNLVASDGYRLVWFRTEISGKFRFIIPGDALQKLLKLKMNGPVQLRFGRRHVIFSAKDCSIVTRLIEEDGRFVDYQGVLPKNDHLISTNQKNFFNCLRRALLCMEDVKKDVQGKTRKSKAPVVLTVEQDESVMKVSIRNHLAQHSETLSLNEPAAHDLKIGFNGRYLAEAVQHCYSDKVEMYAGSPLTPLLIRDGSVTSLVLPVNPKTFQGG